MPPFLHQKIRRGLLDRGGGEGAIWEGEWPVVRRSVG